MRKLNQALQQVLSLLAEQGEQHVGAAAWVSCDDSGSQLSHEGHSVGLHLFVFLLASLSSYMVSTFLLYDKHTEESI